MTLYQQSPTYACKYTSWKESQCKFVSIYFAPTTILMVQLNLNLMENVCGIGLTQHIFILHTWKYACACKINDINPIVQSSYRHTRYVHDSLQMHVWVSGMHMPNLIVRILACMQIVSQGQQYKLYEHVHVLRCDSFGDARRKPH